MTNDNVKVAVCPDCLLWFVNLDDSGASPAWRPQFEAGLVEWPDGLFVLGDDDEPHFSWSPCEVCNALAGDRVDMFFLAA